MANHTTKLTPDDALEAGRSIDSFYLFDETSEDAQYDNDSEDSDELPDEGGAVRLRYVIDENDVVHKEIIS